jgi:fluoride exporter
MIKLACVIAGGSLGAACRYVVSVLCARLFGNGFPWGTLAVNLVGCFLIGLAFNLGQERGILSHPLRLFFMTGFLGALTTLSTLALESINFTRGGDHTMAIVNIAANNIGGLLLVIIGIWVGKSI